MKLGCTITSRGCPKKCGWCIVPRNEGSIRFLPIKPGWLFQDNNYDCPEDHVRAVYLTYSAQRGSLLQQQLDRTCSEGMSIGRCSIQFRLAKLRCL